jgi:hypothetical protein
MQDSLSINKAFIIAWLLTFTLASIAHSQMVLSALTDIAVKIPFNQWLEMVVLDWWGMLPTYGMLILIALAIAYGTLGILNCVLTRSLIWLYPVIGAVTMYLLLKAMHPVMDITFIAGTRTLQGQLLQYMSGFFGGLLYAFLRSVNVSTWQIKRHILK